MSIWQQLLAALLCGFLIWWLYRGIKGSPDAFSKENVSKSFTTMGILALILIAVIGFTIILLRR